MRRRGLASRARSTRCTSTPCSRGVAMGRTLGDWAASTAARRTIRLRPTTVLSRHGQRWPTTARQLQRRRHADPRRRADCDAAAAGCSLRPRLPAVLDRPGASGPGAPLAAAVARPFRPGRLANDLGVLAPHGAACGTGRAYRDLDLPQSTTTVAAAANRQFRRPPQSGSPQSGDPQSGSPQSPGVGIPVLRVAWTVRHRVGRRRADGIRDWIASRQQQSTLEAVVVSAAIRSPESLASAAETYAPARSEGFLGSARGLDRRLCTAGSCCSLRRRDHL